MSEPELSNASVQQGDADIMTGEPITILNPNGRSPFVLMCDHACAALPETYNNLGLPPHIFREHVAFDIGAKDMTERLSARLDACAVLTNYSRLLIDPNRAPDEIGFIPQNSDGIVIPGNQEIDQREWGYRHRQFHQPYHDALAQIVASRQHHSLPVALIGVHSFTPIMQGAGRPWEVGILWNRDPRLARHFIDGLRRDPSLTVGDNEPYSGKVLGYTMDEHGGRNGLANVVVEVRQDLVATPASAFVWADRLADVILPLINQESLFEVRHY